MYINNSTCHNILTQIGVVVAIIAFLFNQSPIFCIWLLPLTYTLSMVIIKPCYMHNFGLAMYIIEIVKICRYVTLPLFVTFERRFKGVEIAPGYNEIAVILMCYELIAVSFVMRGYYIYKAKNSVSIQETIRGRQQWVVPIFFILFFFYILYADPSYRGRLFNFQLRLEEEFFGYIRNSSGSGVFKIFFSLGLISLFSCIQYVVLITNFFRKLKWIIAIIICVLFISCLWTAGTGISRWNMLIGVILSITILMRLYPSMRKQIIGVGVAGIVFTVLVGSLLKTFSHGFTDNSIQDSTNKYFSSQYFDEYFEGVRSVSNCIKTAEVTPDRGISGMLIDWFSNVPYAMKILGLYGEEGATYYYHVTSGHYDLIMPTVTMSLMQFGYLLCPLYSCIAVFFGLFFDDKLRREENVVSKMLYVYVVFWFSLFMAISPNIIDGNIWGPLIGIVLIKSHEKVIKKQSYR